MRSRTSRHRRDIEPRTLDTTQGAALMHAERPARGAAPLRWLADNAFSRAAGAPLVPGNRIRLLRDASENFPAWLDAIDAAERSILFEAYIFADDMVGRRFADALAAKARQGVRVRVLHDWLGGVGQWRGRLWRRLEAAGAEVRCFNPFRVDRPLAWVQRDHRKSIVVDDRVGFVTGLCIAERWEGNPEKGIAQWRDTGIELSGPAVADLAVAFADVWAETGAPIPEEELPAAEAIAPQGDVALRVIATEPATSGVFRLDQLVAALARRSLWITDAYFVGVPSYVQSLRAAALDGVDVRFLVPGASDVALVKPLSVAGYRPLLEAGVRVFEWNGPMLHAKTAVADGRWARVGSSNLNLSSWAGNWELDVAVEDEGFAQQMQAMFEEDLSNATEIVLGMRRRRVHAARHRPHARTAGRAREGSALATAGALRLGSAVGAALGGFRVLGPAEANLFIVAGAILVVASVLALFFPRLAVAPVAVVAIWLGVALVANALRLRREARSEPPPPARARDPRSTR
jgi:cardiolipin synthase